MLSFAAVGCHGREWCARAAARASRLVPVLAITLLPSTVAAQDPVAELAGRIAAAVPGQSIQLTAADPSLRSEMARLLGGRRVSIVDGDAAVAVNVSCGRNLRERICAADIVRNGTAESIVVTGPRETIENIPVADVPIAPLAHPLFAQRGQMLDVAVAGDQLIVLEPARVSLYRRGAGVGLASTPEAWAPIVSARTPPRDLRGRLHLTAGGFDALLPGVTCRGTLKPFAMSCADENSSWPLGIENSGVAPSRNHFNTPEGLAFVAAAPLAAGARARWLVTDAQGSLVFLDDRRGPLSRAGAADDLVRVETSCAPGAYVLTTSRAADAPADDLHLFRVGDAALAALTTLRMPGSVTALWAEPGATLATAIVRDQSAARYDAFHISLSCAR